MGHPLRMYEASDYWFITTRCFQSRMLMTPRLPLVKEVCGGVLAQAVAKHGVELYAYVFMSNHLHLVVKARGAQVARFVKYLLGNLSKKLAPLCKGRWWGRFWERRASVAPILGDEALEARVNYVLGHGVKENLVARAQDWEGLHCIEQLLDGRPRTYKWFDWTKRWNKRNKSMFKEGPFAGRYDDQWAVPVELKLTPLPQFASESPQQRHQRVTKLLRGVEALQKATGSKPLGMKRIRAQSIQPPRSRKLGPRPLCHASSKEDWAEFRDRARAFNRDFRSAAPHWLAGEIDVAFPEGCFKPCVSHHPQGG